MPISSFTGLQTSLRGLLAQQRAIETTGHNIANANTQGYSRQETVMAAAPPATIPAGALFNGAGAQVGTGVDIVAYRRIRDQFLDAQFRAQSMASGDAATRSQLLDQIQQSFQEPGDNGISSQLNKFWNAWSDLSNAPESTAARSALIESERTLAASFATLDQQLAGVSSQAASQYASIVDPTKGEVATTARAIADLNTTITSLVQSGRQPNDLMDRRDLLIDQLSQLGQVGVTDMGNGLVEVRFGDATSPLVSGGTVTWPQALTNPGGKLGALQGVQTQVAQYRTALDGVASSLVSSVNAVHGTPPFFDPAGTTAATMRVSPGLTTATLRAGSGAAGTNDIALAIAALRGTASIDGSYAGIVSQVGIDAQEAVRRDQNATVLVNAIDDRRQSAAGVSLDEEMTNLMRFQRGYQASARTMTTVDEMLDILINRVGRVGL